jgi:hypothetical protein
MEFSLPVQTIILKHSQQIECQFATSNENQLHHEEIFEVIVKTAKWPVFLATKLRIW